MRLRLRKNRVPSPAAGRVGYPYSYAVFQNHISPLFFSPPWSCVGFTRIFSPPTHPLPMWDCKVILPFRGAINDEDWNALRISMSKLSIGFSCKCVVIYAKMWP